jgi:hypothetical protein
MNKLLLISLNPCYPLHHGGAVAQYYFIDGLSSNVEFILCTQVNDQIQHNNIKLLKEKQPNLKIYYVNNINDSVYMTFRKKIKVFLSKLEKKMLSRKNSIKYQNISFFYWENHYTEEFLTLISDVIEKENIKHVQFEFYNTIDLFHLIPNGIKRIFVHHELRFKYLKLMYDKSSLSSIYKRFVINKTEFYEKACLREMDYVVVFNQDDADLIKNDCQNIIISPFAIPDELIYNRDISNIFTRFLFVGGESHNPNALGLSWFLDEIFIPNITQINFSVCIVGDWSEFYRKKYLNYPQIIFNGIVDSIESFFEESIFINPIQIGSGIRTKVLHAFVNKVPVISTRFGAEGCYSEQDNKHLIFFDSSLEFTNKIQNASINTWQQLALDGFHYYERKFNKDTLLNTRLNIYLAD